MSRGLRRAQVVLLQAVDPVDNSMAVGHAAAEFIINDLFWLRAADFGPLFAPKNPKLSHLQVIPVCRIRLSL
jgi:hypothetical protein